MCYLFKCSQNGHSDKCYEKFRLNTEQSYARPLMLSYWFDKEAMVYRCIYIYIEHRAVLCKAIDVKLLV